MIAKKYVVKLCIYIIILIKLIPSSFSFFTYHIKDNNPAPPIEITAKLFQVIGPLPFPVPPPVEAVAFAEDLGVDGGAAGGVAVGGTEDPVVKRLSCGRLNTQDSLPNS